MITRKTFLSLSSLGIISLLFPSFLFSKTKSGSFEDVNKLLKSAADLRRQKKWGEAQNKYKQIIQQYPNEIRAYDGMRKTLLSEKKKEWEVILMFRAALALNPDNSDLQRRLYKEYMNASLGNKKIKKLIAFDGRLLSDVKTKFEGLTDLNARSKNTDKQYSKICKLVELNADSVHPHKNTALKAYNKKQYQSYKSRFDALSSDQLEIELKGLLAKPDSPDRKQHIRELYKVSVNTLKKEKKGPEALNKALNYYNTIDKKDPLFLGYIRQLGRYQRQFDTLITVETQNHALKNSFWSAVSLFDIHFLKSKEQNAPFSSTLDPLLVSMAKEVNDYNMDLEVNLRKIRLNIYKNNLAEAKTQILTQCKNMRGLSNAHIIDKMNVVIAEFYHKSGDNDGKKRIVKIAMQPRSFTDGEDDLVKLLALINMNRSYDKPVHIQNLNLQISKI